VAEALENRLGLHAVSGRSFAVHRLQCRERPKVDVGTRIVGVMSVAIGLWLLWNTLGLRNDIWRVTDRLRLAPALLYGFDGLCEHAQGDINMSGRSDGA